MKIEFQNEDLRVTCEDSRLATKKYGSDVARKLVKRIRELAAMDNLDVAHKLKSFRLHPLKGERAGQYAIDLTRRFRLIIVAVWPTNPGNRRLDEVTTVIIDEVANYHD